MSYQGIGASDELTCLNQANASSTVVAIDNMVSDLAKNWHPTGYFRPAEVQQMLTTLRDQSIDAGNALKSVNQGMLYLESNESLKRQAFEDMLVAVVDRSKAYEQAIAKARAAGVNVINAPRFKDFVIKAMRSISDAYVTASVIDCIAGSTLRWLSYAYNAMVGIGKIAWGMIGVVIKAGEAAIDAVDTAGDIIAFIIRYAPYAGVGLGAYILYNFVKKRT